MKLTNLPAATGTLYLARADRGFTLLEVLVALVIVASAWAR